MRDHKLRDEFRLAWGLVLKTGECKKAAVALRAWLTQSRARAVGWWRREGHKLHLVAFEAAADMPAEVRTGFAEAMRQVSLDQIQLGCVRAAAEQRPVVAREDAAQRGLAGSASWLARFEAQQSLAIPVLRDSDTIAVLAIATSESFDESSETWRTLMELVEALS